MANTLLGLRYAKTIKVDWMEFKNITGISKEDLDLEIENIESSDAPFHSRGPSIITFILGDKFKKIYENP